VLAPFRNDRLVINREHIVAMLTVTYGQIVPATIVVAFSRAEKCWKRGDKALAQMHLALAGVPEVDLEKAQRLFATEWGLNHGITLRLLYKLAGILQKDEGDDTGDDEGSSNDSSDDTGGDSTDSSDAPDSSDFDAEHPRWPAGSPGGIGGEFAPKDEANVASSQPSSPEEVIAKLPSIDTPYGTKTQSMLPDAQAALTDAKNGATLYRTIQSGISAEEDSQYWSLYDPLATQDYAGKMGIPPEVTPDYILKGLLNPDASVITNEAEGIGTNSGGGIQVITSRGGVNVTERIPIVAGDIEAIGSGTLGGKSPYTIFSKPEDTFHISVPPEE